MPQGRPSSQTNATRIPGAACPAGSKQNLRLAALGIALRDAGVYTANLLPKIRHILKLIPETSRDREWKALDGASKA